MSFDLPYHICSDHMSLLNTEYISLIIHMHQFRPLIHLRLVHKLQKTPLNVAGQNKENMHWWNWDF